MSTMTKTFNGMNGTILLNTPASPGVTVGLVSGESYGYRSKLRVTVEMRLERAERQDEYETTGHDVISKPLDFSLTTSVWMPGGRDIVAGGATVEPLREILESGDFGPAFDAQKVAQLIELHEQYHLNGMQAACDHQTRAVDPDGNALTATGYALDNTPACPITGYRYGHKWLVKVLPEDFVPNLLAILADVEPSRVYVHPDLKG